MGKAKTNNKEEGWQDKTKISNNKDPNKTNFLAINQLRIILYNNREWDREPNKDNKIFKKQVKQEAVKLEGVKTSQLERINSQEIKELQNNGAAEWRINRNMYLAIQPITN